MRRDHLRDDRQPQPGAAVRTRPRVVEDVDAAAAETDDDARRGLFRRVVRAMALDLPALPLVYPISALATGPRVASYPTSPQLDEPFSRVRLTEG